MRKTKEEVKAIAKAKTISDRAKKYRPVWNKIREFVKAYDNYEDRRFYADQFHSELLLTNSHTGSIAIRWAVNEELCIATKTSDKNKDAYWIFEEVE